MNSDIKENIYWLIAKLKGKLVIGIDPGTVNFGIVIARICPIEELLKYDAILTADEILENIYKIIYIDNVNIKEDYGVGSFGVGKFMENLNWLEHSWLRTGGKVKVVYEYQMKVNKHTRGSNEYITGYMQRLKKYFTNLIEIIEKKPTFKKNLTICDININSFYANNSNHRAVNKKFAAAVLQKWPFPIKLTRKKIDDAGDALVLALRG